MGIVVTFAVTVFHIYVTILAILFLDWRLEMLIEILFRKFFLLKNLCNISKSLKSLEGRELQRLLGGVATATDFSDVYAIMLGCSSICGSRTLCVGHSFYYIHLMA